MAEAEPLHLLDETRRLVDASGVRGADRDDFVQETLLRVWLKMRRSGETEKPRGLIRVTLDHLRIDAWRKKKAEPSSVDPMSDRAEDPQHRLSVGELRVAVRGAIESLPADQREVVELRFYEGLKFREIADRQRVPLNTALGRMHLAMKRLRSRLEFYEDGE